MRTRCSCPDHANPCKHIAAVFYILAERFDDDPFLIFRWRGRSRETLLENLRELRSENDETSQEISFEQGDDRPLGECQDEFWSENEDMPDIQIRSRTAGSPNAILKRLGEPPEGLVNVQDRLGEYYRQMVDTEKH